MARSSIDALPDPIRFAIDDAIKRGATIDAIVATVQSLGGDVSRSAVGRYSKSFAEIARRQRDMTSVASAFGAEFGGSDDLQGRLMVQLLTSVVTRQIMPHAAGEAEEELDLLALSRLAKAVKDTMGASKLDIDREAKIREEEGKRARAAAAEAADAEGRAAGASDETIERIKRRILGLAA